jgi:hypothetical protein
MRLTISAEGFGSGLVHRLHDHSQGMPALDTCFLITSDAP